MNQSQYGFDHHFPDVYKQFCLLQIICLLSHKLQHVAAAVALRHLLTVAVNNE